MHASKYLNSKTKGSADAASKKANKRYSQPSSLLPTILRSSF
jgi:hypothetical protein